MNRFKKYCENVFVAECEEKYSKGDIITLTTKHNKEVKVKVYNLIGKNSKFYFYSFVRLEDKNFAERKAEKYNNSADLHLAKSNNYYEKSKEGADFLVLAEPIKIGHHSERKHRALIDRNYKRMSNVVKEQKIAEERRAKAEYWESKAKEINLSMPESLEYYSFELEKAKDYHLGLKTGKYPRKHGMSLAYANKKVKDLEKKVTIAKKLWED